MISCVIPAYNEEMNVRNMLRTIKSTGVFDEIIVINDGSTDATARLIEQEGGVIFIDLPENLGKAGAVWAGIKQSSGDIIVLLDADLIGITKESILQLTQPVIEGKTDVCVGVIRSSGDSKIIDFGQKIAPLLSGQQAFQHKLVLDAEYMKDSRFGLESMLRNHFKKKNARITTITLYGIKHIIKEEKMGLRKGIRSRLKMYAEIIASFFAILFK